MSGTGTFSVSTVSGMSQFLQANAALAHALPAPDDTFHRGTAPEIVAGRLAKLQAHDIIVIETRHGAPTDWDAHTYRTNRRAYAFVQQHVSTPRTLPCGHTGVRNLGGGQFSCTTDGCKQTFDRETARAVIGR